MLAVVVGVLWQAYVSGSKYVAAIPRLGNEINEKFAQVSGKKFDLKEAEKPVGKEKEKEDAQLRRTPPRAVEELGVKEPLIETPSDVRAISKESSSVEELAVREKEAPVADVKEKKEIAKSVEEPPQKDSSRLKRKPLTKSAPSVDTTTVINPPEKDSVENDDKDAKFDTPAPEDEMSSKDEFQDAINDEEILAGRVPRNDDETAAAAATKTAPATNAGGRLSPIAKPTRGDNSDACSKAELDGHGSSTDDLLNDDSIVKVITATGGDSCETTAGGEYPKRDDTTTSRKAKPSDKKEAKGTAGAKQHKGPKGSQAKAPLRDPHVIANTIASSLAPSKRSRPADSDSADQPGWNKTKDGAKSASTAPPPLDTTTTTTKSRSVEAKSKKSSSTKLSPTKQSKTTATKRKDDRRSRKGEKADADAAASPKPSIERFQRFLANQKPEFKPRSTRVGSDTKEPSDKGDVSSSENGSVSSPTELDVFQPLFPTPAHSAGPGAASSPPQPPKRATDDSHPLNRRLGPLDDLPGLPSPDDPELASIDPLSLAFPGDSPAMFSFLAQQSRRQSRGGSSGGGGGGGGGNRYNDQVQSPSSPDFDLMGGGDLPYDPLLDNRAVLSRMNYLRRQTSGPDPFLDIDPVPPVPSSSRPSLRSPSPPLDDDDGGGGDGEVPLFHHGSRVFPRRMRNTIWAQRVGRSGRGLVSRPLVDDDPFDGLPPLDVGRRFPYRSHSGPYDWLESDFAGTGGGAGGGGDDHWDLDGGFQPDSDRDRYELLRRQRQQQQLLQATRRARERDPDDVLFGRRRGSSPPPLLNEYYQRSVMARMDSGGGSRGDRSAWTAALQKHRREQVVSSKKKR